MKTIFAVLGCISVLTLASFNLKGQSQSRDNVLRDIEEKRAELQKLEEQFLAPPEADRINYAEFLSQPNTGLLRLLPREIYESDTNKANKKTLTLRGGGAYFSFTTLSHEYDNATDIGLEQGYLQIGFAGADYGMLTNLGDVPLENVTLENRVVISLAEYHVATEESQARAEYRRFANGSAINDSAYKNRLSAVVNNTYLLRSINYDASDVIVAFRVVRQDTDGSIIIAWKLLKKFSKPQLARNN